jgi:serine/threonine protein phosphatase 1
MCRSYLDLPPLAPTDELSPEQIRQLVDVRSWLPESVIEWMKTLQTWYEDDHAIYVHAGLDGEGTEWKHPRDGREKPLLWMREPDFFKGYHGKMVVFGHTCTRDLPIDHIGPIRKLFDDPGDIWVRNDLVGIDTACGKGGFLSAIELPRMKVYESR